MDRDQLIAWYFSLGYSYKLIVCFLYFVHGISLSLRQLKRILKKLNLRRRHPVSRQLFDRTVAILQVRRWFLEPIYHSGGSESGVTVGQSVFFSTIL